MKAYLIIIAFMVPALTFKVNAVQKVNYLFPDTIPFIEISGMPVVNAATAKGECSLIFDTGAGAAVITNKKLSMFRHRKRGSVTVRDINGNGQKSSLFEIRNVRLGGRKLAPFYGVAYPADSPAFKCNALDGIIGTASIGGKVMLFSRIDSRIVIADSREEIGAERLACFPMQHTGGSRPMLLLTAVGTHGQPVDFYAVLDTGRGGATIGLDPETAELLGIVEAAERGCGFDGVGLHGPGEYTELWRGYIPTLEFGGSRMDAYPAVSILENNIGYFISDRFDIVLDFEGNSYSVIVRPEFSEAAFRAQMEEKWAPVDMLIIDGELIIFNLWGTEAMQLLDPGDRVTMIGDTVLEGSRLDECDMGLIRDMLSETAAGGGFITVVNRMGEPVRVAAEDLMR